MDPREAIGTASLPVIPGARQDPGVPVRKRMPVPPSTPTEAILESISDGVFTVGLDWRITSFNRAAQEITGVLREEAIGQPCCEVFRSSMCGSDCALRRTVRTGRPVIRLLGIHKTTLFRRMKRLGISWVAEVQPSIPAP